MLYRFIWIFFVYAFLGWCTEVSYAALVTGKFVNRGFLNGPVCPVYGFGVVIVLTCLTPLANNLPLLFLGSVVLTSALEWLTGFVLEKLFHQRWWDYSDQPFNLSGYVCLRFSIAWGFACMFVVKLLHPTVLLFTRLIPKPLGVVLLFIRLIPKTLGLALLALLGAVMAVDLAATVSTIVKLNRRLAQIDELAAKIKEAANEFGENLAERVLDAAERSADWKEDLDELAFKLSERRAELADEREERLAQARLQLEEWRASMQELLDRESFGHRRLLAAFPRLRSIDHGSALDRLHRRLENLKKG